MPRKSRFTPQQQRMYRRRRIVALIAALVVLALAVFVVVSDVRFAGAVGKLAYGKLHADEANAITRSGVPSPDPTLAKARTAGIPDCTSSDVTLAFGAASADSGSDDSASAGASSSAASSSGSAAVETSGASLSSSPSLSAPSSSSSADESALDSSDAEYSGTASFGSGIDFTAVLTHTSKQNCLVNAAADNESLVVTSELTGEVVYDSSVCDADPVYLLMRDSDEDRRAISWGAYAQTTQCVTDPTSKDAVPAGGYLARLKLAGVDGVESRQVEVYVTAAAGTNSSASAGASGSSSASADAGSDASAREQNDND